MLKLLAKHFAQLFTASTLTDCISQELQVIQDITVIHSFIHLQIGGLDRTGQL